MIAFITGEVFKNSGDSCIIEANGIGYLVYISAKTSAALPPAGTTARLFTYLSVREDGISLFGFNDYDELKMFNMLIGVNGVGPRSAVLILSSLSPDEIIFACLTENEKALASAQGVGRKTAQRIILDLKDKFKATDMLAETAKPAAVQAGQSGASEAIEAFLSLGYTYKEASANVFAVYEDGMSVEDTIKLALKRASGNL